MFQYFYVAYYNLALVFVIMSFRCLRSLLTISILQTEFYKSLHILFNKFWGNSFIELLLKKYSSVLSTINSFQINILFKVLQFFVKYFGKL